jgi:hypothetical protein
MNCQNPNCFNGQVAKFIAPVWIEGQLVRHGGMITQTCPQCKGDYYTPDAAYLDVMMPDYQTIPEQLDTLAESLDEECPF